MIKPGVIINPASHRNLRAGGARNAVPRRALIAVPATLDDLDAELADFAKAGVNLLIVDGGDGTLREVMTLAPSHFPTIPPLAVLPSGKTNALAIALGTPRDWTFDAAIARAAAGAFKSLAPIEVLRSGDRIQRGFLFGAGAFVRGTEMAYGAHRVGAFGSLSVALTLGSAACATLLGFGGWRAGEVMRLSIADPQEVRRFMVLASTLERFPLGLKPFGLAMNGLRGLTVDAPPRRLIAALPNVLRGEEPAWLAPAGYRRFAATSFELSLDAGYVLDGEVYPGGDLTVREGAPLQFVTP